MLITNKIDSIEGDNKLIKKFIKPKNKKLFKSKKSKSEKLFKSQSLAKLRKKLSKNRNLPNFNIKKTRPSFLISNTKTTFNHL